MGKTILVHILAKEMGVNIAVSSATTLQRAANLAGVLTKLRKGDILFIDEIHRLPKIVEEYLIPSMEHYQMEVVIDQGPNAHSVRLDLPRFTLIGSTYATKQISVSLLSHFPVVERFEFYDEEDLVAILNRAARNHSIEIDEPALRKIATHAGGTPRAACNLPRHVRDFSQAKRPRDTIGVEIVVTALQMPELDGQTANVRYDRTSIPSEVRIEVWRRDEGKCVRCGSKERLEFDHIIPVTKGGSNTARNIELLCETCNRTKSDSIK